MGTLFLVVFVDLLGFGIVLPLLPRYADLFQAPEWQIGLLMASFSAMQFVFAPLWGRLSDKYGRRRLIVLGLIGSMASYVLFALSWSYAMLLISRLLAGVFAATIGTAQAYIADTTGRADRGKQMALIGAAFGIGFTFGPAIGAYSYQWFGLAGPGWVASGFSGLALLLALTRLKEPEKRIVGAGPSRSMGGLEVVRKIPGIRLILLLQFVAVFCFANFEGTLALVTKRAWGRDIKDNGLIFTYVGFCLLIAQGLVVRRLMPRVGERNLARIGCLLLGAGLVGIAFASGTLSWILFVLAAAVFGFAMISPSLASLISLHTPPDRQGAVLGLSQSAQSLARIFGPYVGMSLLAVSWATPYWVGTVLMVGAAAAAMLLRPAASASR